MLCALLTLIFVGCGGTTIYFDEELKQEELAEKQTTKHFPLNLSQGVTGMGEDFSLTVNEDGSFSGAYSRPDPSDKGDGWENGTVYVCNFTGEFANFETENDYTHRFYAYNLKTEKSPDEEWTEVTECIRYIAVEPKGIDENEAGYTLYTPEAPLSAVPAEIHSFIPYGSGDSIGVYALINNKTRDVFTAQSFTMPEDSPVSSTES